MKYKHLFFDLDRTLWDFETNSKEVLEELFAKYHLSQLGIPSPEEFVEWYKKNNHSLWDDYRKGLVDKATLRVKRFEDTLQFFGVKDEILTKSISEDYVRISPLRTKLLPYTMETLSYLKNKYLLHIITNGFEEVQHIKLERSGLTNYFEEVITSERAGHKKPDVNIFYYSLSLTGASKEESLMIGDHLELDVLGAKKAEIDQVYFNPSGENHSEEITYEIKSLNELRTIL